MRDILNTLSAIGALAMAATPLLAVGSLAHAGEPTVRPAYIQISGLELSRPSDAASFRRRVDAAATAICSQVAVHATPAVCRDAVREEAVEKLSAEQRRDLRSARGGEVGGWTMAAR